MPGISEAIFESENNKNLEAGIPLLFLVRVRVREEGGGNVVAEGKWKEVFTPVEEEEGKGVEIVETSWMCQDSSVGYSVSNFYFFSFSFLLFSFYLFLVLFTNNMNLLKKGSIFIK